MYTDRCSLYAQIEAERNSKVLAYVTGDRPGMEIQIASDVLDYVSDHLNVLGLPNKISLLVYSRGGDTLAAWTLANMIRQFCGEFEVLVPMKALSAATLISLGANTIVMTKQATIGPIDPSVNSPLNPHVPGASDETRMPVSVEEVAAYFDLATNQVGIVSDEEKTRVFLKLADEVHPLALGKVYRARTQIQQLAEKLLRSHTTDMDKIKKIVLALCSEAGSHDFTINRRAAREIGLGIETPSQGLYELLAAVHADLRTELQLNCTFDQEALLGQAATAAGATPQPVDYAVVRGVLESIPGGSHRFMTRGRLSRVVMNTPAGQMPGVANQKTFEGWDHEPVK